MRDETDLEGIRTRLLRAAARAQLLCLLESAEPTRAQLKRTAELAASLYGDEVAQPWRERASTID